MSPWPGYSLEPTSPLGVSRVFSAAFWGGLWGIALIAMLDRLRIHGARYWLGAVLAGAWLPTLVGAALMTLGGSGFDLGAASWIDALAGALSVNGAWGAATAFINRLLPSRRAQLQR